jgi:hypothetical protein
VGSTKALRPNRDDGNIQFQGDGPTGSPALIAVACFLGISPFDISTRRQHCKLRNEFQDHRPETDFSPGRSTERPV